MLRLRVGTLISGLLLGAVALAAPTRPYRVGLVLDKGGKYDKSFNAAAYLGVQKAKEELKIETKDVEATDDNSFEPLLRAFAKRDYDLIIAVGVAQAEAVSKVSKDYSKKSFAIVDAEVDSKNVRSLLFQEHEGSYLVGAIAAMTSKTGVVGFIGGMDIPLIRRFELGYVEGVKKINPKARVISNYVGVTAEAWNNPAKAKELANVQYGQSADVIFAAAGASGSGLFDAAEEQKKFAIGVDSNQNWVKPGLVLTSMLKRIDHAVFEACKDGAEGKFKGGVARFGLANEGIDYSIDQYNEPLLSEATRNRVNQLKVDIINGKIKVPDYYKIR